MFSSKVMASDVPDIAVISWNYNTKASSGHCSSAHVLIIAAIEMRATSFLFSHLNHRVPVRLLAPLFTSYSGSYYSHYSIITMLRSTSIRLAESVTKVPLNLQRASATLLPPIP